MRHATLNVPKANTQKLQLAPICKGSMEWNKLPPQARVIKSRLGFKLKLRKLFTGWPD